MSARVSQNRLLGRTGLWFVYVGLCAVFGVGAELALELLHLGDGRGRLPSVMHALAGAALIAIFVYGACVMRSAARRATSPSDLKRRLLCEIETLPFEAKGAPFLGVTAGVTFLFGALAQLEEGSPLCSHDAFSWLAGAAIVTVLVALSVRWIVRALPEAARVVLSAIRCLGASDVRPRRLAPANHRRPLRSSASWAFSRFNRPPPIVA